MMSKSRWDTHRGIQERWIIEGTLVLESPAHFGNGDVSVTTDMPLARDVETGKPLLTGASIAGALRSYLRAVSPEQANQLFGEIKTVQEPDGETRTIAVESVLIVNDALAANADDVELRDGVAISPKTRTAEEKKKFDIELLPAGAQFDLCFELNVAQGESDLVRALAIALRGLEQGEIGLGKRKTRGLGACKVKGWHVRRHIVTQPQDLVAWLNDDRTREQNGTSIATLLGFADAELERAARPGFSLSAEFRLDGSLLIRADGATSNSPDMAHLHSNRNGKLEPILSGTSLAGALRARALRIAKTLAVNPDHANKIVDAMFGPLGGKELWASRVRVRESVIQDGLGDRVQNRVVLDRFTGGASPSLLFSEQPVFGLPETRVQVKLELVNPKQEEVGLLLLLLKDLWTGDLPLGGESSVGRGRLRGLSTQLQFDANEYALEDQDGKLSIKGNPELLEQCVQEFVREMQNA